VEELLSSKTKKKLVTLSKNMALHACLQMLAEHDILSAPVLDGKKFLGFVDVLDVCGFTISRYNTDMERLHHPEFVESDFFQEAIENVINFSKVDNAFIIAPKSSLHELIHLMTRTKAHRVAVVDKEEVVGIVTQSDIVSFACKNMNLITNATKSLSELGLVRSIVAVMIDSSMIDALETLYQNKVSGLALLDPDGGRVAGNILASDLRALSKNSFKDFNRSVLMYLTKSGQGITPVLSLSQDATLKEAIELISKERLHRLYLENSATGAVRGIVTLSDIIKMIHIHTKEFE